MLKIVSKGYVTGIICVVIAHIIASSIDPTIQPAVFEIVLGRLISLIFIPFLEEYVIKSKHHIVIGDHEDIKKKI